MLAAAVGLFGVYLLWIHNNLDTTGPVITIDEELLVISVEDPEEALFQGITGRFHRKKIQYSSARAQQIPMPTAAVSAFWLCTRFRGNICSVTVKVIVRVSWSFKAFLAEPVMVLPETV